MVITEERKFLLTSFKIKLITFQQLLTYQNLLVTERPPSNRKKRPSISSA